MQISTKPGLRHCIAGLLLAFGAGAAGAAQPVARMLMTEGVVTAQSPSEPVRVVGKASVLQEGDLLTTGERSFGVIEFGDGARLTLRPNTTFAIGHYNLTDLHEEQNIVLQLFKGGLRAITGAIGKRDPGSVRIVTPTSTIGIRGTSFDARLCQGDCQGEKFKTGGQPPALPRDVLARVQTVWGAGVITGRDSTQRPLAEGVALYSGDQVQTQPKSATTLVFMDQTRVTLNAQTRFEISSYHYAGAEQAFKNTERDDALFRLWSGGMRLATGLIGKLHPESYKVRVSTSTIGIRGTGFDLHCTGTCADTNPDAVPSSAAAADDACGSSRAIEPPAAGAGLFASTWDGVITLHTGLCATTLSKGNAAFINPATGQTTPLTHAPAFMDEGLAQRPDALQPDYSNLFGSVPLQSAGYGLYTYVREGGLHIAQPGGAAVDLSPGQAGFAQDQGGGVSRLGEVPDFILNDPYPLPDAFDERAQSVIDLVRENLVGSYTGAPGRCSIR